MKVRELSRVAFLAAMLYVGFVMFSSILYLEVVTLMIILYGSCLPLKESTMAGFIFGLIYLLSQGIFPRTLMYMIIFPSYACIAYLARNSLKSHSSLAIPLCFICSFALGQLVDLPFLLFSNKITLIYILLGVKTSLIQALITATQAYFLFEPCQRRLILLNQKN